MQHFCFLVANRVFILLRSLNLLSEHQNNDSVILTSQLCIKVQLPEVLQRLRAYCLFEIKSRATLGANQKKVGGATYTVTTWASFWGHVKSKEPDAFFGFKHFKFIYVLTFVL